MRHPILFLLLAFLVASNTSTHSQTSPCVRDTSFHIVVLGSSTAAGSGASTPDSAWVNRYRAYLQSLNPAYQVTNRAVGGFTTYRLMPTSFLAPANRPNPDTNRNITYAIGLNPDAIIVNLPSNDVSQGFTVQEQLDNFDTIINHATSAGIPIWVSTTQPKNFGGSPVPIGKQIAVRDSLFARFSPFVIDFWTQLADSSNQLANAYDSGDGTHLNDAGHGLLFRQVAAADLPGYLYVPPTYVDHVAAALYPVQAPICGTPNATFAVALYNRGVADTATITVDLTVENLTQAQTANYSTNIPGGLANCQEDTLLFQVNTSQAGWYRFTAVLSATTDPNAHNDTVTYLASYLGTPTLSTVSDTGCDATALTLQALAASGDSVRWYDAPVAGNVLGGGPSLVTPPLSSTTTYYAEALRGDFFFRNQLQASPNSTINWNGTMFDLVADSTLILDSFAVKVNTTGAQAIIVHTRPGSHLGFETNAAAWTSRGTFPVQVADPEVPVTFATGGWTVNAGDTLAVYLQMQNSNSRLSYRSSGAPVARRTPELQMITGSGASFNFGGNFYPRDWSGEVYYHFGSKPDADCQSGRIPVEAVIGGTSVDLGTDTILSLSSTYLLDAGAGQASYAWSTGDTTPTLLLDGSSLGAGIYVISVTVTDSAGCMATDEVIVVFAPLVGVGGGDPQAMAAWPNPVQENLHVRLPAGLWQVRVIDLQGRVLAMQEMQCGAQCTQILPTKDWTQGIYLLEARQENLVLRKRISKTK